MLTNELCILVGSVGTKHLDLPLHIKHIGRIVDFLLFAFGVDLLTEHLDFILLPLLQLKLKQGRLILEVGHDDVVPLRQQLFYLEHMCALKCSHLVLMICVCILSFTVFLDNLQFFQSLPGSLGLVEFSFTFADLAMLVKHLKEVVSDEVTDVFLVSIRLLLLPAALEDGPAGMRGATSATHGRLRAHRGHALSRVLVSTRSTLLHVHRGDWAAVRAC